MNPIAGMGGRVGLKGTDGKAVLAKALQLGAAPVSPARAIEALQEIVHTADQIEVLTYPFDMGEQEARSCGLTSTVVGSTVRGETTGVDTMNAARDMVQHQVDLILFAVGDGTSRDVC